MSQHPSLDCLLPLLPFQLTGAIVAGEARGQRALMDGRWGRSWTRAKHQSPASALPIQSLMAVDHTLGPKRQESRVPRSQEYQGNGDTEKEPLQMEEKWVKR